MDNCPDCRNLIKRIPTNIFQKLIYSSTYRCASCGLQFSEYRPYTAVFVLHWRYLFSAHSRCLNCGSRSVQRAIRADPSSMLRNPFATIQALLLAPILECDGCRRQYYDWRSPYVPSSVQESSNTHIGELTALDRALNRVNPVNPGPAKTLVGEDKSIDSSNRKDKSVAKPKS